MGGKKPHCAEVHACIKGLSQTSLTGTFSKYIYCSPATYQDLCGSTSLREGVRARLCVRLDVADRKGWREKCVADMLAVTLCYHLLFDRNSSSPGDFLPSVPLLSEKLCSSHGCTRLLRHIPDTNPTEKWGEKRLRMTPLIFSAYLFAAWEILNSVTGMTKQPRGARRRRG